jgi:psiF repeat
MTSLSTRAAVTAIASLLLVGSAFAQTPAPAAPAATAAPADKKAASPRTAASLECSKQADEKGLKGKERKKFRSDCKKEAKAKAN